MIGRLGFLVAGLTILAGTSDGEVAAQRGPAARPSHSGTAPSLLRPAAAPAQAGLPAEPVSSETAPPPPQAALSAPQTALFSAVVPGTGQMALGQRRAWAYLALETVGWIAYLDRRSAGSELRNRYRDFAWTEARLQAGSRIDGDFHYYETLSKWRRSGRFDADPAIPGVQPEPDEATFNGSIWARASDLYLPGGSMLPESDPQYQRALDYYREHAYRTEFLWDWTGSDTAQEEFGSLIRRSDDRFRQATNVLGLVLANHLVSMVDAFVSARLPRTTVQSGLVPSGAFAGARWTTRVEVRAGW